jgi:hypothetical protein
MDGLANCVLKFRSPIWDLLMSTAGCLVFAHGYSLVAIGKEPLRSVASDRAKIGPRAQLADVDALDPVHCDFDRSA